jgi:hypothetical protein
LSGELKRCEQVTKLPLAANHYWHTGNPSSRNHDDVGIKTKSMSNADFMRMEVASQRLRRTQRLSAEEAATQSEFSNIPFRTESFSQATFTLETTQLNAKRPAVQGLCQQCQMFLRPADSQVVCH